MSQGCLDTILSPRTPHGHGVAGRPTSDKDDIMSGDQTTDNTQAIEEGPDNKEEKAENTNNTEPNVDNSNTEPNVDNNNTEPNVNNTPGTVNADDTVTVPIVYVDGACKSNGSQGAQGGLGVYWGEQHPLNVSRPMAHNKKHTSNRAELQAAITALTQAQEQKIPKLTVRTDSNYVKQGISNWIKNWKTNGWKTSKKSPVLNKDLWVQLDTLQNSLQIQWEWIPGHQHIKGNEEADKLARAGAAVATSSTQNTDNGERDSENDEYETEAISIAFADNMVNPSDPPPPRSPPTNKTNKKKQTKSPRVKSTTNTERKEKPRSDPILVGIQNEAVCIKTHWPQ